MASYIVVTPTQLLQFVATGTVQGQTLTPGIASNYASEAAALTYLDSMGWSVIGITGHSAGKEYILTNGAIGGGSSSSPSVASSYKVLPVTTNTATHIAASYVVGYVNNSQSAQTVSMFLYDSTGSTSGTPIASIGTGMGISEVVTFPAPGLPLANGLTALASGAPNGAGFQVLYK